MTSKSITESIAIGVISTIIVLSLIGIISAFLFGAETVNSKFMGFIHNQYVSGLFMIIFVSSVAYFRKSMARSSKNDWLQRYGFTNQKIKRIAYCKKFNLASNIFFYIYHITGKNKSGEPLEAYFAVDRFWSVKSIIWISKPTNK